MSLFSWFSTKPTVPKAALVGSNAVRGLAPKVVAQPVHALIGARPVANAGDGANALSTDRKVKRQARREQLYSAIRESMTRAGMLSASYKFKVLSLDQKGNQFLVMMDVAPELSTGPEKLTQTEALLIQTANVIYNITVTAVYWRTDTKAIAKPASPAPVTAAAAAALLHLPAYTAEDAFAKTQANPPVTAAAIAPSAAARSAAATQPTAKSGHDPLLEAEVAAFKRALAVPALTLSSAALQAAHDADKADKSDKSRTGLRSYTLITGFEDTEMPDSPVMPALSNTQYGDLR